MHIKNNETLPALSAFRSRCNESGQSTVEFALTLILVVGFILFFFQLSMMMAFGNYVQYATFMAARAYLAAGLSPDGQQERARQVIQQMLKKSSNPGIDRFPFVAKGDGLEDGGIKGLGFNDDHFKASDHNYSWMQGIRYSFKGRLFLTPIGTGGKSKKSDALSLSLTSESFLGREPTSEECQADMKGRGPNGGGIYDNGC